jgi:helix-turn-helix protein
MIKCAVLANVKELHKDRKLTRFLKGYQTIYVELKQTIDVSVRLKTQCFDIKMPFLWKD